MGLRRELLAVVGFLTVGAVGCALFKPYRYNVRWENRSGVQLTDVRISYGNFTTTFGGHLCVTEPLTPVANVEFRTMDGTVHQKPAAIPDYVRRSIRLSDLFFVITPELDVHVELKTSKQIEAERRDLYRRMGWAWPP